MKADSRVDFYGFTLLLSPIPLSTVVELGRDMTHLGILGDPEFQDLVWEGKRLMMNFY